MHFFILVTIYCTFSIGIISKSVNALLYKPRKKVFNIILLCLCILCALRGNDIRDTTVYLDAFLYGDDRFEIGFQYLIKAIKTITTSPPYIFGFFALISVGMKMFYFRKYSTFFIPTILVYICGLFVSQDLIAIRAAIVSGLLLWSFHFAMEKKVTQYLLVALLSTLFHTSGFLIFLVWPIVNLPINLKYYLFFIPISYALYFGYKGFGYLVSHIQLGYIQALYDLYTENEVKANVFGLSFIADCLISMYLVYSNKKYDLTTIKNGLKTLVSSDNTLLSINNKHIAMLKLYTFACALYILVSDVAVFSARLAQLFFIISPLVIGNIYIYMPREKKRYFKIVILLYCLLSLTSLYRNVL